jgi:predicted transcriptional regulator
MSKQSVISARVDAETLALVDEVASAYGRSRAWIVAEAVKRHVEQEREFLAFVQAGIDEVERGEYIEHEDMMLWIADKRAQLKSQYAAKAA